MPGGKHYTGTYLPQIAGEEGWNVREAVDTLVRKAGWRGEVSEGLREGLKVTRYQPTHHTLTFQDATAARGGAGGVQAAAMVLGEKAVPRQSNARSILGFCAR